MTAMTASMSMSEAELKIYEWSNEAESVKDEDLFVWMNKVGIPYEINIRLVELWRKTREISGQVIHVGRIIVYKIIEFVRAHPHAALGAALGAALSALTNLIPIIGPMLAPVTAAVGAFLGALSGAQLDHPEANSPFQGLITMAMDFFRKLAEVFTVLKNALFN